MYMRRTLWIAFMLLVAVLASGCSLFAGEVVSDDPPIFVPPASAKIELSMACFGLELFTVEQFSGQVGRWANHTQKTSISCTTPTTEFTGVNRVNFLIYSEKSNGAQLTLQIISRNEEGTGYYADHIIVDWEGWREFSIPLNELTEHSNPGDWDNVTSVRIHGGGWGADPLPDTDLVLSSLYFTE